MRRGEDDDNVGMRIPKYAVSGCCNHSGILIPGVGEYQKERLLESFHRSFVEERINGRGEFSRFG